MLTQSAVRSPIIVSMAAQNTTANIPALLQARIQGLRRNDDWAVQVARFLLEACEDARCSDLHLTCQREEVLVRGRTDGGLFTLTNVPIERRDQLISRFKVLAEVPPYVRHEPQDGRIEWRRDAGDMPKLLRASFLPTIHGESVVIRFPEPTGRLLELESLGMPERTLKTVQSLLMRQEGTILLTGPSSNGKTTTMYAMLNFLNENCGERLNFLSIEDPVERDLGFAGQVQVNETQGLTFARTLRAALRQDPNILMIGEMRDTETARIAIQAGMSGHLVISTLHAGRACRVFTRLLSMEIEPYLVASALTGVEAQRLARLLCTKCRKPNSRGAGFVAAGCEECSFTGVRGRTGIFEITVVTEELRDMIISRATPERIAQLAAQLQLGNLVEEGKQLRDRGDISLAEYEYLLASDEA